MPDILSNIAMGFGIALTWQNIGLCLFGCVIGTAIGVLPGIGPLTTMAMILPVTFWLSPVGALIMLSGVFYGAQYGGSTTAILVKIPGETSSVITVLDGHAMAQRGRAGPALAIAALGSLFAGSVVTLLIAIGGPPLAKIALLFQSADYVSVMLLGLVSAVVLAHGSVLKAIGMIVLGVMLGLVGTDVSTGEYRMTMGLDVLFDGIGFVPLSMGLFGLAEIMVNLETTGGAGMQAKTVSGLWPTRADLKRSFPAMVRGTVIGTIFGILPGGGPTIAAFSAYSLEKKVSKTPERFGKGAIEGVAAPESANNAGAQTSFIPMLTLGIPSNPTMALMIGALTIQGIAPGPQVMTERPDLFWGLIASMWVGNLMLLILNLPMVGLWIRLLAVPYRLLFPAIFVFCCIGVYTVDGKIFDVYAIVVLSALAYVLLKLDCEPAPLILGFILGPLMEENLRRSLMIAFGDVTVFVTRPISAAFLIASVALLVVIALPTLRAKREEAMQE
jgi:TctA family transporter